MEMVMNLTGCTQEEAEKALRECNGDPVDAIDKLLNIPQSRGAPKKKELDETQKKFSEMRKNMEEMDRKNDAVLMKTDQHDCSSSQGSSHSRVHPQEQLSLNSHHTQQSQILIPELEEQTQGTACPSQSE